MAQQQRPTRPAQPPAKNESKKRKEHPSNPKSEPNKRAKAHHGAKQRDSRALAAQTSSKALKNGELDVDKFVKAREYEIRALEDGMSRSKKALTQRAFQQVPKDLRRRTASHNVKRVPKRLQKRAKREMVEDNTPTVTARRRKPTRHMRLRLETAKKLRALGAKRKVAKANDAGTTGDIARSAAPPNDINPRPPKVKPASLAAPPMAKVKFRKRQINKTWLPTHMFHAKRARMTSPSAPLWRFAIPLTPTAKSYRPTHRAANERGAVAWDVSYVSTIGLTGQQRGIDGVLKAMGVDSATGSTVSKSQGTKWRNGSRVWEGFMFQREPPHHPLAPATVIWCARSNIEELEGQDGEEVERMRRFVFVRVHSSAFLQIWEELVRLSNTAKPQVVIEDLRFEIGSIEVTGPGATEALQAALWPSSSNEKPGQAVDPAAETWKALKDLPSQSSLPSNILLGFEVQDPRLHFPPRKGLVRSGNPASDALMDLLTTWPLDSQQLAPALFDRKARQLASSKLPSQKAINRRKALAVPGEYPAATAQDPEIPALLYSTTSPDKRHPKWTVLLPWKCVQPVWYSIMYHPLSTGGQPRFGGLDEKRQLAFETGRPWFPGDYPGTKAGWQWEIEQRKKREDAWKRRPKSKRVNWDAVQCGEGRKGEIGLGWACDWERLSSNAPPDETRVTPTSGDNAEKPKAGESASVDNLKSPPVTHLVAHEANVFLKQKESTDNPHANALATVHIKLLHRGVPHTCARIYRLPSDTSSNRLRKRWLDLHPRHATTRRRSGPEHMLPHLLKDVPAHVARQRLAASLLEPPRVGDEKYPVCPGEEDLIGFITTGNFDLGEGQGMGVGSILLSRVKDDVMAHAGDGRLCVVRNAGDSTGRLASWEIV